jgi:hypothetical protein
MPGLVEERRVAHPGSAKDLFCHHRPKLRSNWDTCREGLAGGAVTHSDRTMIESREDALLSHLAGFCEEPTAKGAGQFRGISLRAEALGRRVAFLECGLYFLSRLPAVEAAAG